MNKNEYILKEEAILAINGQPTELHYPDWYASQIKVIKPVDVAPVVHAYWIPQKENYEFKEAWMKCSACGYPVSRWTGNTNFCPNCGAIMDEKKEE